MQEHERYMYRCLELAEKGAGNVAPNPKVGAVLVHDGTIIGEGYHHHYGGPHAEVNAVNDVPDRLKPLIPKSTLYVSLEPCSHFGKTPPCTDLIISHKIPSVVIGCRDPFFRVNGSGINKLKEAGIEVIENVLEKACIFMNRRFNCFYNEKRPYIILKWAETADGFIGKTGERIKISGDIADRMVHKLRSEEAAIMVGSHTIITDDPELTVRLWEGRNPVRVVDDRHLSLSPSLKIFNDHSVTLVINEMKQDESGHLKYIKVPAAENRITAALRVLYEHKLNSLIVEGGNILLNEFIQKNMFDEIIQIVSMKKYLGKGIPAPSPGLIPASTEIMGDDRVNHYYNGIDPI